MLKGVDVLADAVQVTLGPKGKCAIMEQAFGAPKISKDGVTVAKSIELKDKFQNMGAQLVRQVASKTNDVAGDGTTTSTILARFIFAEGCKAIAAGRNPMDVNRGIKQAAELVIADVQKNSREITSPEEICSVATISANSDVAIGELIARAMKEVGKEGVITVQDGNTMDDELEVVEGMKFDRGYISPYFMTDNKTQKVEFENPLLLLVEKKVSQVQTLLPILEAAMGAQRPLLILAEDVEQDALNLLILNKLKSGIKVAASRRPASGTTARRCCRTLRP